VLKKQEYILSSADLNINIEGLNDRFEQLCIFDSNEGLNDKKYISSSVLIAIGATQELSINDPSNALVRLQQFYDSKKGWLFGYLTYDLKNATEILISSNSDNQAFPLLQFFAPQVVVEKRAESVSFYFDDEYISEKDAKDIVDFCFSTSAPQKEEKNEKINIQSKISKEEYINAVNKLKEHIYKGDIYEINFCQEFFAEKVVLKTPLIYKKLNEISGAPFSAYCKFQEHYLMCASPERFLKRKSDRLLSQPIKGTIRRSKDAEEDEELKKELYNNDKERSENVMIVDLVRNDLSRIAKKGSVEVEELFGIYTFKQVHHMISSISCELKETTTFTDIIRSMFPMGSMTGAPKISAMKLIEEHEKTKRGLYSGAVGYISPSGDFDFNVVIRSILYNAKNKYLSFITGSAITEKAEAEKEYEECLLKAKAMFEVLSSGN
jgi:para-aminobenzoate synthetase component I